MRLNQKKKNTTLCNGVLSQKKLYGLEESGKYINRVYPVKEKYHLFICLNRSPLQFESAEIIIKAFEEGKLKMERCK